MNVNIILYAVKQLQSKQIILYTITVLYHKPHLQYSDTIKLNHGKSF